MGEGMVVTDLYVEARRDLDQVKKLLRKLHLKKEQEIALRRVGKRLAATEIKEMRELESAIEGALDRPRGMLNAQQRSLFENVKNQYLASMRSWRNRLGFAEQYRTRRRRARLKAREPDRPDSEA